MSSQKLPINDGWTEIDCALGEVPEHNKRIGNLLNEACYVFHHHAEGVWRSYDKDAYASRLAKELRSRPGLAARLLNADDRVIKVLTFRALELNEASETHSEDDGVPTKPTSDVD